jgi:8-oxo-dGTP diphosphatase
MEIFGEKLAGIEYFYRPGSYGLIVEENLVGVVKSARSGKYFPGGGGHGDGESETAALRREAREEIGFEIDILEKIGTAIEYFYAENDRQYIAKEGNFYRVQLLGRTENEAGGELLWIDANQLGEMFHRSHRWIVEQELRL